MSDTELVAPDFGTPVPGRRGPGRVLHLRIDRVERRNAFTQDMYRGIKRAAVWADAQTELDAVCLTGTDEWFGAGGDMGGRARGHGRPRRASGTPPSSSRSATSSAAASCGWPRSTGSCHAGGLDLTLRCDVTMASDQARFRVPELLRGIPDPFMSARLAEAVGLARARYLFFTAAEITAHEAEAMGLVGKVVPHDELDAHVDWVLEQIALTGPQARFDVKRDLNLRLPPMDYGMFFRAIERPEMWEGMASFLEKRAAGLAPGLSPSARPQVTPGPRRAPVLLPEVKKLGVYVATIFVAGAVLAVAVIVAVPALGRVATAGEAEGPPIDLTRFADFAVRSQVYAADGSLLATLHGEENRQPVTLDQIPATVKDAILAVEDAEFYQHRGVNLRALTRAMVENVQAGGVEQGGSTITQQLVKNALLNDERVLNRKVKEAALAIRLENQMTKDEILESYLNTVYFGSGAYGVQAAAETYWGKNVGELNWAEAAMLAGGHLQPHRLRPDRSTPTRAKKRRDVALDRMVAYGAITREEAAFAKSWALPTGRCTGVARAPSGRLRRDRPASPRQLLRRRGASRSCSTEQPRLRRLARHHLRRALQRGVRRRPAHLHHPRPRGPGRRPGGPRHHLGRRHRPPGGRQGRHHRDGLARLLDRRGAGPRRRARLRQLKYDIATHEPGRQTGSTFKTFVMLTALEQGVQPDDYRRRRRLLGEQGRHPRSLRRVGHQRLAHLGRGRLVERRLRAPRPDRRPRPRRRHGRAPRRRRASSTPRPSRCRSACST